MYLKLKRNATKNYLWGFLILLIIEVFIARYVIDDFVRPYLGDFLVVILIYCFLMMISKIAVYKGLLIVLLFSFTIEFLQIIDIVNLLPYQSPEFIMIVLGSSFSLWDLVAYTLGIIFTGILEDYFNRKNEKK
tara:strand:+ start:3337 stop:3735 length:399 start_codon:yes stop_codon:yes gene_type:complete